MSSTLRSGAPLDLVVVDELGPWAPQWDRLVELAPLPSPFLRSWWLGAVAVGEPRFVLATRGDELKGGAAFQVSVRAGCEWVEMLGDGPLEPDHLDLVSEPCEIGRVNAAVRGWLGRPGSRVIDLVGLTESSWLASATPGRGSTTVVAPAPYLRLPGSYSEFLAGLEGRLRSTITRTRKRLDKAGYTVRVRPPGEWEGALSELRRLHDDRWGDASGFMAGWDQFVAAVRAGVPTGEIRFTELVDPDGEVVATEVDIVVAGRASFYQAGRLDRHDLRGSGSALKGAIVEQLIAEGVREYDLLRGGEPYKDQWATGERRLIRVRRGVGPRGLALVAAAEANRQLTTVRHRWAQRRARTRAAVPSNP